MAWTTTKKFEYAAGDKKVQGWALTADSATIELATGLGTVSLANLTPGSACASAASFGFAVKVNANSSAVAANGTVSITGAVSGSDFFLTVWGN